MPLEDWWSICSPTQLLTKFLPVVLALLAAIILMFFRACKHSCMLYLQGTVHCSCHIHLFENVPLHMQPLIVLIISVSTEGAAVLKTEHVCTNHPSWHLFPMSVFFNINDHVIFNPKTLNPQFLKIQTFPISFCIIQYQLALLMVHRICLFCHEWHVKNKMFKGV